MEDDDDMAVDLPTPPESVGGKSKSRGKKRKDRDEGEPKIKIKRIRVRVKEPQKELCTLCPNNPSHEKLLPTDDGKQAHALCALYIPETYISEDSNSERIYNVASIDKARMGSSATIAVLFVVLVSNAPRRSVFEHTTPHVRLQQEFLLTDMIFPFS